LASVSPMHCPLITNGFSSSHRFVRLDAFLETCAIAATSSAGK
jgi:hypothetical protein